MHAYLGELQDVEHPVQSYLPEGAIVKLPLIYLPDIVRVIALRAPSASGPPLLNVNACE